MTEAPPSTAAWIWSARRAKSAERIEGSSSINLGSLRGILAESLSLVGVARDCSLIGERVPAERRLYPTYIRLGECVLIQFMGDFQRCFVSFLFVCGVG